MMRPRPLAADAGGCGARGDAGCVVGAGKLRSVGAWITASCGGESGVGGIAAVMGAGGSFAPVR